MHVIGTAGHVDHGKSTLVEALTGVHPDRLKEEREREMTIDLGFAWMTLPDGEEIGIVDVPGHRDFIENMLAGVGGIDAVLFVVAADEGVMPQTREHLAILDLLQIEGGVVALTKVDLIEDEEWLDLVEADLCQAFTGTVLEKAPIVRVSARSKKGLPALIAALGLCLKDRPARLDLNRPRLPIDRVFTIAGFGSVVTGTLLDGQIKTGDEVEILPQGIHGRVRGLETHKHKEDLAVPGSRTAINLSGIAVEQIQRGNVVARPGQYVPTRRLDVRFRLLTDVIQPLNHNTEVKLFIGASETVARLRLLGSDELAPGEESWLQLELAQEVVAVRGDRYILRRPSPGETLGGGMVVDAHPKQRHKRFSTQVLASLEALTHGTDPEVLHEALLYLGVAPLKDVIARSNLDKGRAAAAAAELQQNGTLIVLESASQLEAGSTDSENISPAVQNSDLVISKSAWEQLSQRSLQEVEAYHRANPLRLGMPREELKSRLKPNLKSAPRLFNVLVRRQVEAGLLAESGPLVRQPGHAVRFTPQQAASIQQLLARFAAAPSAPPSVKECQADVGEDVFQALLDNGQLIAVSPEVVFRRQDYDWLVTEIRGLFKEKEMLTAAEVRDHFNTSRRYVLALLEHLDAIGVTQRQGDVRRLRDLNSR